MLNVKSIAILATMALLSSLAHARGGGMEIGPNKVTFVAGEPEKHIVDLVGEFHTWALAKSLNPSLPNSMVSIPIANTKKRINGGEEFWTQARMDAAAGSAAANFGYGLPLNRILTFKFRYPLITTNDFLGWNDDYIKRELAHGDPAKGALLLEVKRELIEIRAGRKPIDFKVLGPSTKVNMYADIKRSYYCRTVSCDQDRIKVPVRVFGNMIDKIIASGILDENDMKGLKSVATLNYYFVQLNGPKGPWVLEEAPSSGVGFLNSVLSQ